MENITENYERSEHLMKYIKEMKNTVYRRKFSYKESWRVQENEL